MANNKIIIMVLKIIFIEITRIKIYYSYINKSAIN